MSESPTEAERQALCLTDGIMLNGLPARISGWAQHNATVFQVETGWWATLSWPTVARVVKHNGGQFTEALSG